ncbi:hypothetical protein N3K66_002430 [Trichothecium roseum]|uniref:Uncharacterized protein n=1 Tax=Trichothecium roseum TaxID=47278 RepID=A0ACC0VBD4_9HYPO|nr:hypothetical protein N3K66_002430 [Trichothecium roseum]
MGNLCGKADKDNFSSPGRVVGSAPAQSSRPSAPVPRKVGGPGRTLGGGPSSSSSAAEDARQKAALAAEARAKASSKPGGKLQAQLAAQKKQNRGDTLKEVSDNAQRARDADDAARARQWD